VVAYKLGYQPFWTILINTVLSPVFYWGFDLSRSFNVFLATVLAYFVFTISIVIWFTVYFGNDFGFQFLLIIIFPVTIVSGRINLATKLLIITFVGTLFMFLSFGMDFSNKSKYGADFMRAANLIAVMSAIASIAIRYFQLVTEQQAMLQLQASHDVLTGLLNRRGMLIVVYNEIARADRHGTPLSFILCDLDRFKKINDSFGHDVGDVALRHASNLFQEITRSADRLSRWGGEEFLMVLPHTSLKHAILLGERISRKMNETSLYLPNKEKIFVTATIAVTQKRYGENFDDLLKRVDRFLYVGKEAGRNRVVSEDSLS
jgi:diguanylate cyclase (GGDEF)-like protein